MTGWHLQEALLTKRAQNLILWALGSYGAAAPNAQCLGMKMLMDDGSIIMCSIFLQRKNTKKQARARNLRKDFQPKATTFPTSSGSPVPMKKGWLPMIIPNFNNTLSCRQTHLPKAFRIICIRYNDLTVLPYWNDGSDRGQSAKIAQHLSFRSVILLSFTLWYTKIALENHHLSWVNQLWAVFNSKLFVYQRAIPINESPLLVVKSLVITIESLWISMKSLVKSNEYTINSHKIPWIPLNSHKSDIHTHTYIYT